VPVGDAPLRIALVLPSDFAGPSEKQALGLAHELASLGHAVQLCVAGDPASLAAEGLSAPAGVEVGRYAFAGPRLDRASQQGLRAFAPHVVHAWSPRVPQVMAARDAARATGARVFVHFEDNDFVPWPLAPGLGRRAQLSWALRRRAWRLHPPLFGQATAGALRWVRARADGLDALAPALAREVRERLRRECRCVLPVLPEVAWPAGDVEPLRGSDGPPVVLFTGRVAAGSLGDFLLGVRGVAELRRRGVAVRLVQTGAAMDGLDLPALAADHGLHGSAFSALGHVPFPEIPRLLMAADVLVQPGPPSEFNRLRLPSKLQTYLASGTPTVSFGVGVDELVADGDEALLTHTDRPEELADRLYEALTDAALRARLAAGGPVAARRLFDRRANTLAMLEHYRSAPA
jgi:glycosyltransferase involved in cell wall biosynthesis